MFALALNITIMGVSEQQSNWKPEISLTFHETLAAAREKVILEMLGYTMACTLEEFIDELKAGGDLEVVPDFDNMDPDALIQWVRIQAIGGDDETHLVYEIKEVPFPASMRIAKERVEALLAPVSSPED